MNPMQTNEGLGQNKTQQKLKHQHMAFAKETVVPCTRLKFPAPTNRFM